MKESLEQPREMRAIYFEHFGEPPRIQILPVPLIQSTSVLVQVRATGLCRSDWHGWKGHDRDIRLPHVPGHEFAGEIIQAGADVQEWNPGDRVTTPFIQACGHCVFCREGNQQVCEHQEQAGFTYWGSFAEYVEVKNASENLVRIPPEMSFEEAAVLGCRFGTAYRAVVSQARVSPGQFLLVVGCGGVGLSAIMIAKAMGVRVAAIDLNPASLMHARLQGAEKTDTQLNSAVISALMEWSGGGMHACLDAIGKPSILQNGLSTLRRRGRYVQVGLMPDQEGIPTVSLEKLLAHELEIIGSHGIQSWKYAEMLQFIVEQKLDIKGLIKQRCGLGSGAGLLMKMDQNKHDGITVIYPGEDPEYLDN